MAALLVLAALAFDRALRTRRTREGVVFLAVLTVVCGARSLYRALRPASDFYDAVFFGRATGPGSERDPRAPARYWGLILGLPIVFGVGLAAALGRGPGRVLDRRQRLLAGWLCFNIAFVAVVGNFLELGENNRFRFETDPLSLCLLGLALQTGIALVRRRRTASSVSTGE